MSEKMIALISGSHRINSQSIKVTRYLKARLESCVPDVDTCIIDLAERELPLWNEEQWDLDAYSWNPSWGETRGMLQRALGIIVVSPEWGGMVPAALKNLFLLCGPHDIAHKPGLIVGVSSTQGGCYPVAELRMSSYKNTHICYLPNHLVIRQVRSVLNDAEPAPAEAELRERIDSTLEVFAAYVEGMVAVRSKVLHHLEKYPYGM
jgi:NAD(P)H-dependent FMN reductase